MLTGHDVAVTPENSHLALERVLRCLSNLRREMPVSREALLVRGAPVGLVAGRASVWTDGRW